MKSKKHFYIGVFIILGALGIYASFIEPRLLRVSEWTVSTPKWTYDKPLRIALVSDTHAIWPWTTRAHLETVMQRVNALEPDIVLLLGDYVGDHPFGLQIAPADGVAPFATLRAPCGVYAVMGNHDMEYHQGQRWADALSEILPVLRNQSQAVSCGGRDFWVSGLRDLWYEKADYAASQAMVTDDKPVILMMHNPDSFPEIDARPALSVAGHTHGGQIRFPFIGAVEAVIPSRYGERYIHGHIQEDEKDMVVTSGIGMVGLPLRFMTVPEIALVTLRGRD